MKKMLIVILLITLFDLTFLAPIAKGQTHSSVPSLPAFLPVASKEIARDWNLTNQMWKSFHEKIIWTGEDGVTRSAYTSTSSIKFRSYAEFMDRVVTNGMKLCNWMITNIPPHTEIQTFIFISSALSVNDEKPCSYLLYRKNIGPLKDITEDTFRGLSLNDAILTAGIPVPGLERFELQSDKAPGGNYDLVFTNNNWIYTCPELSPYTFIYENGEASESRYMYWQGGQPYLWTIKYVNDTVILSDWCLGFTNRVRYTITANGQTNIYTQWGEILRPTTLSISADRLDVNLSSGADVVIESSSDLKDWKTFATFSWSNKVQNTSFPINNKTIPCQFFRARSW